MLTAIVAGYEVCCRLGNALRSDLALCARLHPTATAGTYGAAAARQNCLIVERADHRRVRVSMQPGRGLAAILVNGAWNKRYQVGAAAMNGVIAATWRAMISSAVQSVEGSMAFGRLQRQCSSRQGGRRAWRHLRDHEDGVKPYPSCRYTHAALDTLIAMRRETI